jgi:hypothetical protein
MVTPLEWFLSITLFALYIMCIFTVCMLTFKKGHMWLGILGIFFPFLWLIGAILPAKHGSRAWIEEGMRHEAYMQRITD